MLKWEVWVDIEAPLGEAVEVVCTLFARLKLPMRPNIGERITFHSAKGSEVSIRLMSRWAATPSNNLSCTVDDISYYRRPIQEGGEFSASLRFEPVAAESLSDANEIVQFLSVNHGFEIDPYGVNKLSHSA